MLLVLFSSIAFAQVVDVNPARPAYWNRDEDITGNWNFWGLVWFNNATFVNYTYLNVTGGVNASEYCIGNDCIDEWADVNVTETDPLSFHTGENINDLGYTIYANYFGGVVGLLSADGDPWYLGGGLDFQLMLQKIYVLMVALV